MLKHSNKEERRKASLEVIHKILPIVGASKVERIDFPDCTCVVKIGDFNEGQLVLVLRAGTIIPKELSKAVGIGRKLAKTNIVDRIILRGTASNCIIVPITKLSPDNIVRRSPEAFIGVEISGILGITASSAWYKTGPKKLFSKIVDFFKGGS